jgi:hypothetical protein
MNTKPPPTRRIVVTRIPKEVPVLIQQPNCQVDVQPEILEAARRAGYVIRPSVVPGMFDLYRENGTIGAAGVSRENLEIAAAKW